MLKCLMEAGDDTASCWLHHCEHSRLPQALGFEPRSRRHFPSFGRSGLVKHLQLSFAYGQSSYPAKVWLRLKKGYSHHDCGN